ncbi:hypothetical protein GCM10009864_24650 [Streptomyces lunalinharesii]|uniref:Uncharacterized protein n=2 Tax=Streptomyces lunalinharesii TaxID=333384 RepID=A0ABN3RPD9_9ACTN
MLAYLREGDQLVPPDARSPRDREDRYDMRSAAAEPTATAPNPPERLDVSPDAWYRDGLDEVLGRSVVEW